jgi:hypothetical protein
VKFLSNPTVVVAGVDADGEPTFLQPDAPLERSRPSELESQWIWAVDGVPTLFADVGGAPVDFRFPAPGGSLFGIVCFPPRSAGRRNLKGDHTPGMNVGEHDDPSMHATNSVDYEIILSGKVDICLPGGQARTLGGGDCLIMAGVPHSWQNHYDEPCMYAAIVIGANAS